MVRACLVETGWSIFNSSGTKLQAYEWKKNPAIADLATGAPVVVKDELGTVQPYQATLHVQLNAKPRFFKPRPVPFAIKNATGQELDHLEKQGIIKRVDHSKRAAPIIAVPKKDRRFRLCGDYKVTINQVLEVDQYLLPSPEELLTTLANGTCSAS